MGNEDQNLLIRLRPETRAKFGSIAASKRWTLAETADALADEFLEKHGIAAQDNSNTPQGGGDGKTG